MYYICPKFGNTAELFNYIMKC